MKEWLEVRCCCNPEIMLGHMAVARGTVIYDMDFNGPNSPVRFKRVVAPALKTVCLEIAEFSRPSETPPWNFLRYKAVKSGHLSLDQLKTIPDFMPL